MSDQAIDTSSLQGAAKQTASEVVEQVEHLGDSIQSRVVDETDVRSTQAGDQVGSLGHAMRGASEELRSQGNDLTAALTEQVAVRAERLGRYLRQTDGRQILDDVQGFAREQPWLVAAVGLAAGVAVARLLKASARGSGPGTAPALPARSAATSYAGSGYDATSDAPAARYPSAPGLGTPPSPPGGAAPYPPAPPRVGGGTPYAPEERP
jgi:hypothetical protein